MDECVRNWIWKVPCDPNATVQHLYNEGSKRYAKMKGSTVAMLPRISELKKNNATMFPEDLIRDILQPGDAVVAYFEGSGLDSQAHADIEDYSCKVLVVGDSTVGKTSIIGRYVHNAFTRAYKATIGVDFHVKEVRWDANTIVKLCLWDIAGQERFGSFLRVYYQHAKAAFVVFDVTNPSTLDSCVRWKADIDEKVDVNGEQLPVVLLANKVDALKPGQGPTPEALQKFCEDNGFAGCFFTSAKEGTNLEEAGRFLIQRLFTSGILFSSNNNNDTNDEDKIILRYEDEDQPGATPKEKSDSNCC
jgi:small GTP-binding protein